MRTWIHCTGEFVEYRYEPDAGKVLTRTWRTSEGVALEICFHCDQAGQADGKLESEVPHDADHCDLCDARVMPGAEPFDLEAFLNAPDPKVFDPDKVPPMDLTDEEWQSFDRALRESRGRRAS